MSRRETLTRRVTVESTTTPAVMKEQQQQTFPFKLYEMLEYAHDSEFSSSLSWLADGSVFLIHDKDVMMNDLAPMFFRQTQFRSFTRQLNIWGFVRTETTLGGERGGWQHKDFIRGRPDLLKEIERIEFKGNKSKSAVIAAADVPVLHEPQGSVSQKFSYMNYKGQTNDVQVQDSVSSLSSSSVRRCSESDDVSTYQAQEVASASSEQEQEQAAESISTYDVGTTTISSCSVAEQPPEFNDDDLMHLASIFEKDEHLSEDLHSFLSLLDQETTVEDFIINL